MVVLTERPIKSLQDAGRVVVSLPEMHWSLTRPSKHPAVSTWETGWVGSLWVRSFRRDDHTKRDFHTNVICAPHKPSWAHLFFSLLPLSNQNHIWRHKMLIVREGSPHHGPLHQGLSYVRSAASPLPPCQCELRWAYRHHYCCTNGVNHLFSIHNNGYDYSGTFKSCCK